MECNCQNILIALLKFLTTLLILSTSCRCLDLMHTKEAFKAYRYLEQFGYIKQERVMAESLSRSLNTDSKVISAIKRFQKMANITQTGALDEETLKMMNKPRCGMPDVSRSEFAEVELPPFRLRKRYSGVTKLRRVARYVHQSSKWYKERIHFHVESAAGKNSHESLQNHSKIKELIQKALNIWANHIPIDFVYRNEKKYADIVVKFGSYDHGDAYPFDGPGRVLAHAFYPEFGGDVHFDDSEAWSMNRPEPATPNLFISAVHEIGHSLGLAHSANLKSVMAPFYQYQEPSSYQLHHDDIEGVQALYGKRRKPLTEKIVPTTQTTRFAHPPSNRRTPCDESPLKVNAATQYAIKKNSKRWIYHDLFFINKYMYQSIDTDRWITTKISDLFTGVDTIDAALFADWTPIKVTYVFSGDKYWRLRYNSKHSKIQIDVGYPRKIKEGFQIEGDPTYLDAVFRWSGNGQVYAIKGNQYWKVGDKTRSYPKPLYLWGLPSDKIDSVMQKNGKTFFFIDSYHYLYDDYHFEILRSPFNPSSTKREWFKCNGKGLFSEDKLIRTDKPLSQSKNLENLYKSKTTKSNSAASLLYNTLSLMIGIITLLIFQTL